MEHSIKGLPQRNAGATFLEHHTELLAPKLQTIEMSGDFTQVVADGRPPLLSRSEVTKNYGVDHGELIAEVTLPERLHYDLDNPAPPGVRLLVFDARLNKNQPPYYKVISAEDAAAAPAPKGLRGLIAGMRSAFKEIRAGQSLYVGREAGRWMPQDFWRNDRTQADRDVVSRKQLKFFVSDDYHLIIESEGKDRGTITMNATPEETALLDYQQGMTEREDQRLLEEFSRDQTAVLRKPRTGWRQAQGEPGERRPHTTRHKRATRHIASLTMPK